jgi:hypothetical protein
MHAKHSGAITWTGNAIANLTTQMLALDPEAGGYSRDLMNRAMDIENGRRILEWLEDPAMSDENDWWEERKARSYYRILYDEGQWFALADVSIVTPPPGP